MPDCRGCSRCNATGVLQSYFYLSIVRLLKKTKLVIEKNFALIYDLEWLHANARPSLYFLFEVN